MLRFYLQTSGIHLGRSKQTYLLVIQINGRFPFERQSFKLRMTNDLWFEFNLGWRRFNFCSRAFRHWLMQEEFRLILMWIGLKRTTIWLLEHRQTTFFFDWEAVSSRSYRARTLILDNFFLERLNLNRCLTLLLSGHGLRLNVSDWLLGLASFIFCFLCVCLDYVFGRRIINFQLICCIFDCHATFRHKADKFLPFVLLDRNVASLLLVLLGVMGV